MRAYSSIHVKGASIDVYIHGKFVCVQIDNESANMFSSAYLTAEQIDELIRALAAARIELSKEPPR